MTFIMEWLAAAFAAAFIVGIIGFIVVNFVAGFAGEDSSALKITKIIFVICGIVVAIFVHGYLDFSDDGSSGSFGGSSHSCCICGDKATREYGGDYWCTDHYYLAKGMDGDFNP